MTLDTTGTRPDAGHTHGVPRLGRLGWALLGVSVLLNLASMAVPAVIHHPLTRDRGAVQVYLDVFEEGNLPTWWSTGLLGSAALLYVVVGSVARSAHVRGAWAWFVGAVVLGALSLDDHTALHERLDRVGRRLVSFDGFPFYWLLPGLLVAALVVGAVLLLATHLSGLTRWCLIGGCALLLFSALAIEALQGTLISIGESGPVYVLTYHAEELGENLGVLLMIATGVRSLDISRSTESVTLRYFS